MIKIVQVINKKTGDVLADFVLSPVCPSEFSIEFDEGLACLFVVRDVATGAISDRLTIGNADIKIKIIEKNI